MLNSKCILSCPAFSAQSLAHIAGLPTPTTARCYRWVTAERLAWPVTRSFKAYATKSAIWHFANTESLSLPGEEMKEFLKLKFLPLSHQPWIDLMIFLRSHC